MNYWTGPRVLAACVLAALFIFVGYLIRGPHTWLQPTPTPSIAPPPPTPPGGGGDDVPGGGGGQGMAMVSEAMLTSSAAGTIGTTGWACAQSAKSCGVTFEFRITPAGSATPAPLTCPQPANCFRFVSDSGFSYTAKDEYGNPKPNEQFKNVQLTGMLQLDPKASPPHSPPPASLAPKPSPPSGDDVPGGGGGAGAAMVYEAMLTSTTSYSIKKNLWACAKSSRCNVTFEFRITPQGGHAPASLSCPQPPHPRANCFRFASQQSGFSYQPEDQYGNPTEAAFQNVQLTGMLQLDPK